MTLDSHSKLGVAQIIFYTPTLGLDFYHLVRHGRPRMIWILLLVFTLIRVVGGIILILASSNPDNLGLEIADIVLLSVGVVPLIAATIGLIRLVTEYEYAGDKTFHRSVKFLRLFFVAGVILLAAGASLFGQYGVPDLQSAGLKLIKAGYVVVTVLMVMMFAFQGYLCSAWGKLNGRSHTVLIGGACAVPFLVVRMAYALLSIFTPMPSRWAGISPGAGGDLGIFVGMGLVMEYIVVLVYLTVGFLTPSTKGFKGQTDLEKR